jgi:nucleotide-binding universal stress UspA family protein
VDLAEQTTVPLKYALHLGRITRRPVCVVHVIEDPWQYEAAARLARLDWDGLRRQIRDDAATGLEQRIRAECEKSEGVERLVLAGKPYREILQLAEERDAAMIVVGRQEAAAARAALFGSTAEHLMRGARCPVLSVRSGDEARRP